MSNVELPLPGALRWLGLALPFVWLGGREMAWRLTEDRSLRAALAPGFALALWLLAMHIVGILTHSFVSGLVASTLGIGLAGLGAYLLRRSTSRGRTLGGRFPWLTLVSVFVTTLPIARIAFGWGFHDEDLITGHMSIAAEIQNDIYPPRHLTFAHEPLRYHYGFNLFTACIGAIFRTPGDVSIDIASVVLWPYLAWLVYTIGETWFGRNRGVIALISTLFAGGIPYCLTNRGPLHVTELVGVCRISDLPLFAPVISFFFQHPWALGLPFAMAALLVASTRDKARPHVRMAALGLLFLVLSFSHVVLFVTVVPSIIAVEFWVAFKRLDREAAISLVVMVGMTLCGTFLLQGAALGGEGAADTLRFVPRILTQPWHVFLWHAQSFGLALPIALVGLSQLPTDQRWVMRLLLLGSLFVVNTIHYAHSDDTIKFGIVIAVTLGLAAAQSISRILDVARRRAGLRRFMMRTLAIAMLVGTATGGFSFALFFYWEGATRYFGVSVPPIGDEDARAASFIRSRIRAGEIVFRTRAHASSYARWAGLPIPWSDWGTRAFGFSKKRISQRQILLLSYPNDAREYIAQDIVWFVLTPADRTLLALANQWVQNGAATEMATFGELRIFYLRRTTK